MTQVVIFADASLNDNETLWNNNQRADIMYAQPAKSAGPYRIATEARLKGYTTQLINLLFHFDTDELETICDKFINNETIIVGFSTTFWDNPTIMEKRREFIKIIIKHTRQKSEAKIVLGGTLALLFAENMKADACFTGFAEGAFTQYIDYIQNKILLNPTYVTTKGTPVYEFNKNYIGFDFNSSQILYQPNDCLDYNESVVIEITRGCIFKCDFCAYPLNGKKKLDYIKYENTLRDELIRNYELYGISNYTFSDDTFNDSPFKVELLHKLFTSLPFSIKFSSYLRIDLLHAHKQETDQLKEMGLIGAFFGIESLNYNSAKSIGKGMDPEKVKEFLYDLKATYWKDDVNVSIGLISGLPHETMKSHNETLDWILNKKYCLVDRVRPAALAVFNPKIDKMAFKSEFQLNASKYGYYWPDPKSHHWKNMLYEIKSREQALAMSREIYEVADSVNKTVKGNFMLMLASNISRYADNPLELEDLCKMDNETFTFWYRNNYNNLAKKYVENYKSKILGI